LATATLSGCAILGGKSKDKAAPPAQPVKVDPLDAARRHYEQGNYGEALIGCVDVAHTNPAAPGLTDLREKILTAISEERAKRANAIGATSKKSIAAEMLAQEEVPDTYHLRRFSAGATNTLRTPPSAMQKALEAPVSLHLKGANLGAIIAALCADTNLNIIADAGLGQDRRLDVELEKVPLRELLDFVGRNFGIEFYVGQRVIWATRPAGQQGAAPLETRIYRLRHGLQFHGGDWFGPERQKSRDPNKKYGSALADLKDEATDLSRGIVYLEEIIKRFVPLVQGADFYFDRNTHILLARNSHANLAMIEDLLEALDVNPPQVLIEARFIETVVSDLRELGIDWALNSPIVTSRNGQSARTQISANNDANNKAVTFEPVTSENALGKKGAFGDTYNRIPETKTLGLNLTYQGILTQPEFSAVLHALDMSGKGQTLSVPRVTTVNNNPAKLRNGQDLRYYEEFQVQAFNLTYITASGATAPFSVSVLVPKGPPSIEELGITLIAVPSVGADLSSISLLLMPTISKLDGFVSYQDPNTTNLLVRTNVIAQIQQVVAKLPIFLRKEIQTKAIVQSGETVVLGGLIDTVKQETISKVPFLSSLPLIGKLFQRLDVTDEKKNLLIFVTATVISERGESLIPF
jgi:type IV pilus assembly protein PilQ